MSTGHVRSRIDTLHHSAGSPNRDRVHRHAQISRQVGGLLGVKRLWDGRFVVAIGQEDEDFSFGGAARRASRPHAIASPMLVPSSPVRADRTASIVSCRNR